MLLAVARAAALPVAHGVERLGAASLRTPVVPGMATEVQARLLGFDAALLQLRNTLASLERDVRALREDCGPGAGVTFAGVAAVGTGTGPLRTPVVPGLAGAGATQETGSDVAWVPTEPGEFPTEPEEHFFDPVDDVTFADRVAALGTGTASLRTPVVPGLAGAGAEPTGVGERVGFLRNWFRTA